MKRAQKTAEFLAMCDAVLAEMQVYEKSPHPVGEGSTVRPLDTGS